MSTRNRVTAARLMGLRVKHSGVGPTGQRIARVTCGCARFTAQMALTGEEYFDSKQLDEVLGCECLPPTPWLELVTRDELAAMVLEIVQRQDAHPTELSGGRVSASSVLNGLNKDSAGRGGRLS